MTSVTSETLVAVHLPDGAIRGKRISQITADEARSAIAILTEHKEDLSDALVNPRPVCNPPKLLKEFIASADEKIAALNEKLAKLELDAVGSDRP